MTKLKNRTLTRPWVRFLVFKQCKITDISKKLHIWSVDQRHNERIYVNLFDRPLERYEGNIVLFRLFNRHG